MGQPHGVGVAISVASAAMFSTNCVPGVRSSPPVLQHGVSNARFSASCVPGANSREASLGRHDCGTGGAGVGRLQALAIGVPPTLLALANEALE